MEKEITLRKDYLTDSKIDTIYFGGGTPSILSTAEISRLIQVINKHLSVSENVEITLEANPDDLSLSKLKELKEAGINRLSIGIQSFFDEHLQWMNRAHTSKEAIECVKNAQNLGFNNITIDLIYAIPEMTMAQWKSNVFKALELNVQHISAYNLTIEEGTALHHFVKSGKSKSISDEVAAEQFQYLIEELEKKEFVHYEVSNFGKENFFSRHNTSYWLGKNYLGIGPSAHSFNGSSRQWNIANNKRYIDNVNTNGDYFEKEELTPKNQLNEYLLTGLRTIWGCDLNRVESQFGKEVRKSLEERIKKFEDKLIWNNSEFRLTKEGLLFADGIAMELFE